MQSCGLKAQPKRKDNNVLTFGEEVAARLEASFASIEEEESILV